MKHILITAGPTHEAIDAVRYMANRSKGRMGIAIAEAARDAGWDVTMLLGPVCEAPPERVRVERFTSSDDLSRLLDVHFASCDVLVMAAAVADYRPALASANKLTRKPGTLLLELVSTPDLVRACADKRQPHQRIVGFSLEEPALLDERALQKLNNKKLDAIVANPLETMGASQIVAKVFTPGGRVHIPDKGGTIDKTTFAVWLVSTRCARFTSRTSASSRSSGTSLPNGSGSRNS